MKMKKTLSLTLVLVMLLSLSLPGVAQEYVPISSGAPIPVIVIAGDAEPLYDVNGTKLLDLSDMSNPDNASDKESDGDTIMDSVANVLQPFLVEGLLQNNWEPYYENLQKEIGELLGDALLDCNGEQTNGSSISASRLEENAYNKTHDKKSNGLYYSSTYPFWYDWRLDPIAVADDFHEYVLAVKRVTNQDKVAIVGKCLGTSVILAYVEKYGLEDICGVGFDGGISNGSEAISEIISGKFKLDGNAITRFMQDCNVFGLEIDSLITSTIDLLTKSGTFETLSAATKMTIYYRVIEGVTSALALSTVFTWPSYWAGVTSEDFETAKKYVFGEEGSEKRTQYAGLLEKIDNYDVTVRQHITEIVQEIGNTEGVNLAIISKYGMQMFPAMEARNMLGDQIVSVARSSFGATTSTIYDTLSDEYIAGVTAAGKAQYISPDRQVNATTCLFPDNTWFVKGASHTNWTWAENNLLLTVATYPRQLTIADTELSQFMVFDNETKEMSKMTVDNCDCYNWTADEKVDNPNFFTRIVSFFRSLINWFREVFGKISASREEPTTVAA